MAVLKSWQVLSTVEVLLEFYQHISIKKDRFFSNESIEVLLGAEKVNIVQLGM